MPHQCTNCGRTFDDGSKEMLSGCPDCGGNKFQFRPSSATGQSQQARDADSDAATESSPSAADAAGSTDATGEESTTDQSVPSAGTAESRTASPSTGNEVSPPESEGDGASNPSATEASGSPDAESAGETPEDQAQQSARSAVASSEELDRAREMMAEAERERMAEVEDSAADADDDELGDSTTEEDNPDLSALREELNNQFESIKIVAQGQYELNLMELYDREEYIISLREDGRYVIEVPDTWRDE